MRHRSTDASPNRRSAPAAPNHDCVLPPLLPDGPRLWWEALVRPRRLGLWPYTEAELRRVRANLGRQADDAAIEDVIFAARYFLCERFGRYHEKPSDPRRELPNISQTAAQLTRAMLAASPEALDLLPAHLSSGGRSTPIPTFDLIGLLFDLRRRCDEASRKLPERNMIGAPDKLDEAALAFRLWTVWERLHPMQRSTRGWPAFRSLCMEPLMNGRFPTELRPSSREERGSQMLLARARAHAPAQGWLESRLPWSEPGEKRLPADVEGRFWSFLETHRRAAEGESK
jgi:hypothetical protein